ncbi:ATP-binding cassette domain-containing protein [Bacillus sp. SD088]|uniref:ATP-binding cassette domain-containing protein n=1 Tax=Bacillus sp. SD088 TaxID=2782012 RepID=UPI001A97C23B|nr:ABC transporter ATP-binding protein [Bacillus sp. SD088]MBO0992949.1 ABC transporter ATP-binding protein [Bacillus sp. SD088]
MNIKANNLHFSYGNDEILRNIDFEITEPKIYGLLGRNGAGKTTLLSLLGSFRVPTSGQILIDGEQPFENARIMQDVTFMYDKDYTGESDAPSTIIKYLKRYRPNFDLEYAESLLKKFKLEGKKSVSKLSKGKQSAFNVVVGLASRSPITIFDEVYLGMDAPARDLFYKELLQDQELHPRIIILSTHLVSEMEYLFDEVIMIKDGKILLHEQNDRLISYGITVVGNKQAIQKFTEGKNVIHEEQLGDTRSITLFGELSTAERASAKELRLDIAPVSLHNLFIHLTEEGN